MDFEIIDFHTHPYYELCDHISQHKEYLTYKNTDFPKELSDIGITKFCGTVLKKENGLDSMILANDEALLLKDMYNGAYIPGFTVDARFPEKSIEEAKRAKREGTNLIGELVPGHYPWKYSDEGFSEILDYLNGKDYVVSLHSTDDLSVMSELAKKYKETSFVFAHPGELKRLLYHIEVMKACENVYLDLSGTGLFRLGMLKRLVKEVGSERILFGTDHPVCNPGMYVGGVLFEKISDKDKENILSSNAKRLLSIK